MANFRIGKVEAGVFQAADLIVNHGAVTNRESDDRRAAVQLDELLQAVRHMRVSGALDDDNGDRLDAALREAVDEARAPAPRRRRLASALENAKVLAAGLTATAGMVGVIDGIIRTVSGGVSG